jgi:hypothetical protein
MRNRHGRLGLDHAHSLRGLALAVSGIATAGPRPVGGSTARRRYPVTVAVEGELHALVPEEVLDGPRVNTTPEQQRATRPAEIHSSCTLRLLCLMRRVQSWDRER